MTSIETSELARVRGGAKVPTEIASIRQARAENAREMKRYNRPVETPAGKAVVDALSLVPWVKDPAATHRVLRGVTEGTAFHGIGRPAY